MRYTVPSSIPRPQLLSGIHGLRGVAALAIVAYHLNQISRIPLPRPLAFVGWEFGHAVHLFFVISAFSLLHSHRRNTSAPDWMVEYGIRRFFRIAPLFYAALVWYLVFYATSFERRYTPTDVALNFGFLFNLTGSHGSSLVWAGWTIGVEALFYLLFPAMVLVIRTRLATLVALAGTCAVGYGAHLAIAHASSERDAYVAFPSNLGVFVFGFLGYRIYTDPRWARWLEHRLLPGAALALLAGLCLGGKELRAPGRPDVFLWAAGFAVLCATQARRPSKLLENRFLAYAGDRSFSVYLVHPQVLFFLGPWLERGFAAAAPWIGAYAFLPCLLVATGVTLAVAEVTHRSIEAPGIRAGRWLIERRRMARAGGIPRRSVRQFARAISFIARPIFFRLPLLISRSSSIAASAIASPTTPSGSRPSSPRSTHAS